MGSSAMDLHDVNNNPQSPTSHWTGLDDFPLNSTASLAHENDSTAFDIEVEQQPISIPDLNFPSQESQLGVQGEKKELGRDERRAAYGCLLERLKDGRLKRTATREVALIFGVSMRTMQRLWKWGRESGDHNHATNRVKNCGRKRVEIDFERMRDIPLRDRTTIGSLAFHLGVSRHFVSRMLKEGAIRRHSNSIKPILTADNQRNRIKHCLSSFDPTTLPDLPTFFQMENTIHNDEKWFFFSKKSQTYYLMARETDPVRTSKNSNFIPKVMFLAAVVRPRFDSNGICTFDGKIGVFPLVEHVAAIRSSQNRPRGTIEIKPIAAITREVIRDFMIRKVVPAIANKWPRESMMDEILIQQDNAKTHIHVDDVEFLYAVHESGLNVRLVCQPPNSPDLNVLDLEFFRAIQSLQSKECAKSVVELVAHVEEAYLKFEVPKSNHIFLTLQSCMIEVLKCLGSNTYKIPHMKKDAFARTDSLPSTLQCCPQIYATAFGEVSP